MDYFFEIMDMWEKAKKGELDGELGKFKDKIPGHKVILEAIGGASAGGMTATIAILYAMYKTRRPAKLGENNDDNYFYNSWVNMGEPKHGDLMSQVLNTSDLEDGNLYSLFNSDFIDRIASELFETAREEGKANNELPEYISESLELILTHFVIPGLPLKLNFLPLIRGGNNNSVSPSKGVESISYDHFVYSKFKRDFNETEDKDKAFKLPTFDNENKDKSYQKLLKNCTIATGAFPVGLKYRELDSDFFTPEYRKNVSREILEQFSEGDNNIGKLAPDKAIKKTDTGKNDTGINTQKIFTVDGGVVNNDPFGEVFLSLIEQSTQTGVANPSNSGLIMIEPFPDSSPAEQITINNLQDIVPQLIHAVLNQSRVKRWEMQALNKPSHSRTVVFPIRWIAKGVKDKNPLACGAVGAFSGLLKKEFREHDFFLGRNNARNFFRMYFTLPYDENDPNSIFADWHPDVIDALGKSGKGDKIFLPIIPDMNVLIKMNRGETKEQIREERLEYDVKKKPKISLEEIHKYKKQLRIRINSIFKILSKKFYGAKAEDISMSGWLKFGLVAFLLLWYRSTVSFITKTALKAVKRDLKEKELLE